MGIGRNRKLGNLGNFRFCSKSYPNLLVFVSAHFFGVFKFWVTSSVKIRGVQNFRHFRVFDLGYRSKSKTRKSRKLLFFLLMYRNLSVFRSVHIFVVFKSWVITTVRTWKKRHISEISEFFLGIGKNRKLGNLENFHFFLKPNRDLLVFGHLSNFKFFTIVTWMFFASWVSTGKTKEEKTCKKETC